MNTYKNNLYSNKYSDSWIRQKYVGLKAGRV